MTDLAASFTVLAASAGFFLLGTRVGEKVGVGGGLLGYLVPVLFSLTALTVAAHGEEPATFKIWQTDKGVYTDMPERYAGESKRWKPSRDRLTPMRHKYSTTAITNWSALAGVRYVPGVERCMGVFLGNALVHGGAAVCRGERAVITQERVRERGSITTTTDTVLLVGGHEVMRIHGPRYNHTPRARTVPRR